MAKIYKLGFNKSELQRKLPELRPWLIRNGFVRFSEEQDLAVVEYSSEEDRKAAHDHVRSMVSFLAVMEE